MQWYEPFLRKTKISRFERDIQNVLPFVVSTPNVENGIVKVRLSLILCVILRGYTTEWVSKCVGIAWLWLVHNSRLFLITHEMMMLDHWEISYRVEHFDEPSFLVGSHFQVLQLELDGESRVFDLLVHQGRTNTRWGDWLSQLWVKRRTKKNQRTSSALSWGRRTTSPRTWTATSRPRLSTDVA